MFLEHLRKNVALCCCNRPDRCISPPLGRPHRTALRYSVSSPWCYAALLAARTCIPKCVFPSFMRVGYLLECIPVTKCNNVCPTPLKTVLGTYVDGRKTLGDAGFSHIESLCLRGDSCFPPVLFGLCVKEDHTIASRRIGTAS